MKFIFTVLFFYLVNTSVFGYAQEAKNDMDNMILKDDEMVKQEEPTSAAPPTTLTTGAPSDHIPSSTAAPDDSRVDDATTTTTTTTTATPTTTKPGFARFLEDLLRIPLSFLHALNTLLSSPLRSSKDSSN